MPAVLSKWAAHIWPHLVPREFTQAAAILFLAFVAYRLLHFILTSPQVDSEVLCAATAVYLILGLMWGFAYSLIAGLNPKAFAFTVAVKPNPVMLRFEALVFQFHHADYGWLRRHRPRVEDRPLARRRRSGCGNVFHNNSDRPACRHLFERPRGEKGLSTGAANDQSRFVARETILSPPRGRLRAGRARRLGLRGVYRHPAFGRATRDGIPPSTTCPASRTPAAASPATRSTSR